MIRQLIAVKVLDLHKGDLIYKLDTRKLHKIKEITSSKDSLSFGSLMNRLNINFNDREKDSFVNNDEVLVLVTIENIPY